MHRLPNGPGLDVFRFEGQTHSLSVSVKLGWINGNHRQPAVAAAPRRFGHEGDAGQVAQGLDVGVEIAPARLHPLLQHLELPAPAGRQHVAETLVVADLRMLVVRGRIAE